MISLNLIGYDKDAFQKIRRHIGGGALKVVGTPFIATNYTSLTIASPCGEVRASITEIESDTGYEYESLSFSVSGDEVSAADGIVEVYVQVDTYEVEEGVHNTIGRYRNTLFRRPLSTIGAGEQIVCVSGVTFSTGDAAVSLCRSDYEEAIWLHEGKVPGDFWTGHTLLARFEKD